MFVIIGLGIVFVSIIIGFTMHGGKLGALMQINEFIVLGGAGLGSVLVANPLPTVVKTLKSMLGLLKGNPYTQARYLEMLQMLYDFFMMARREGLVTLDQHVERPHESKFFAQYTFFFAHHHALDFLSDTMRVVITGTVASHDLAEMMEIDLETSHEEALVPAGIVSTLADSMPGFGIVAAVLGVVITMQAIGGPPEQIGEKVGAALVGTFLGILLAYGIFAPLANAMTVEVHSEGQYMNCIKCALLSFARGDAPLTAVEYARRNIEPRFRPSFMLMEQTLKNIGGGASSAGGSASEKVAA